MSDFIITFTKSADNLLDKIMTATSFAFEFCLSRNVIIPNVILGFAVTIIFFALKRKTELAILNGFSKISDEDFEKMIVQCGKDNITDRLWDEFAKQNLDFMGTLPFAFPENKSEEEIDRYLEEENEVLNKINNLEKESEMFWKEQYGKISKNY